MVCLSGGAFFNREKRESSWERGEIQIDKGIN
jgi:hypothetical protein